MHREARRLAAGQSGVTLIELIITIVVISIALTGTLVVISRTVGGSADPMIVRQAVGVAEAYLEEILLKPYYDPVLGAGVTPLGPEGTAKKEWTRS